MMYAGGVLLFIILVSAPFVLLTLHEEPTCFDGIMNQNETDIDRGGPCQLLDERYIQPHAVLWARSFPVREGFHNAVAYIENPNSDAGVFAAAYEFRMYDDRNILIAERLGVVPVFPGKVFPIYESRIDTGARIPARTFFAFIDDVVWERMENPTEGIHITGERLSDLETMPRVDAVLENRNISLREDIVVIATLFDAAGNAVGSSRTVIDRVGAGEGVPLVFTWPNAFEVPITRVDIIPLALPEN